MFERTFLASFHGHISTFTSCHSCDAASRGYRAWSLSEGDLSERAETGSAFKAWKDLFFKLRAWRLSRLILIKSACININDLVHEKDRMSWAKPSGSQQKKSEWSFQNWKINRSSIFISTLTKKNCVWHNLFRVTRLENQCPIAISEWCFIESSMPMARSKRLK